MVGGHLSYVCVYPTLYICESAYRAVFTHVSWYRAQATLATLKFWKTHYSVSSKELQLAERCGSLQAYPAVLNEPACVNSLFTYV